ncbi:MAG: transposase domain-containing protein [Chitinophagaceae bacterium]
MICDPVQYIFEPRVKVGTCKMNDVNPLEWLTDVLDRINEHPSTGSTTPFA